MLELVTIAENLDETPTFIVSIGICINWLSRIKIGLNQCRMKWLKWVEWMRNECMNECIDLEKI